MREREIVIRLKFPGSPPKRWLVVAAGVVVCLGVVAYGALPHDFTNPANQTLSSQKMMDNFNNLDGRVSKFENIDLTYIAVTPSNSWVNDNPNESQFGFFKDPFGTVHVRGTLHDSKPGETIYTLPAGYRPSKLLIFATICSSSGTPALGQIDINSDGTIVPESNCSTTGHVILEGMTFRAEQ
jgi:hypothetical protein